jgi:hypothetical protein
MTERPTSTHQMCYHPDEEQAVNATEEPGKTGGAMGPPLPMLAERPVRLEDGGLVSQIFDRLLRLVEFMQARDEFLPLPFLCQLDAPQPPLPQRVLLRQAS